MATFNSYVKLPEGTNTNWPLNLKFNMGKLKQLQLPKGTGTIIFQPFCSMAIKFQRSIVYLQFGMSLIRLGQVDICGSACTVRFINGYISKGYKRFYWFGYYTCMVFEKEDCYVVDLPTGIPRI